MKFTEQVLRPAFTMIILAMIVNGCNNKEEAVATPEGMHVLTLTKYGKPFSLFVPDTAANRFSVEESGDGALMIRSGKNFNMVVYEQEADLALKKRDISEDEINRLVKIHRETPDGIVWESAITEPEHHFVLNRKLGDQTYSFMEAPGERMNEADIQRMFESASSARTE